MKIHSLTLFGCLMILVGAKVIEKKNPDDDAKLIIERLYSNTGGHLNSKSTLKLLKQLSENYSSRIDDARFVKKKDKLKEIIEVNNITHDKCNLDYFIRLKKLIKSNSKKSISVYNYLREQRNKQFLECKEVFEDEMKLKINELDKATKDKIQSMRESIIKTSVGQAHDGRYLVISLDLLKIGVSNFIIKTSRYTKKQFIGDEDGKELFSQEFAKIPAPICVKLKEKLSQITDLFTSFIYGPESEIIDQLTIEWLENMKICSIILQDVHEFSKEAFEMMKSYKPKQNVVQRLLNFIFRD